MAAALRSAQKRGEYRAITDAWVFKTRLSDDLKAISHDLHIQGHIHAAAAGGNGRSGGRASAPGRQGLRIRETCRAVPNDVGYIKFDAFVNSHACTEIAIAAMRFLAHVDAIIFDLRDNHGGGGEVGPGPRRPPISATAPSGVRSGVAQPARRLNAPRYPMFLKNGWAPLRCMY